MPPFGDDYVFDANNYSDESSKTSVETFGEKRKEKMLYRLRWAKKRRVLDKQRAAVLTQSV
jgi:hypothetical protein